MANAQRGEVEIVINDTSYIMRPTFEAIANIEDYIGVGVLDVAREIGLGTVKTKTLAFVIMQGIIAGGRDISLEEIGSSLVSTGVSKYYKPISKFLGIALGGIDPNADAQEGEK